MAYKFLSDEWVAEARKIREEAPPQSAPTQSVKMNVNITDVPFGDGTVDAHFDTSGGQAEMDVGHLEGPDVTATMDYDTAKAIMVDGDAQAAMQAFMAGKIKLQGDMTKALAMQSDPVDPEIAAKIKEITE